ncbi:thiamine biosynthesis protein ThiS [beta proteobacterium AAP99]|nr:thiamine biosynthesis protein ThiS [beta proteobacterium AAP99]
MVTVEFAPSLRRHVDCPLQHVSPQALGEALHAALQAAPTLAPYVFDEQGAVRKHVAVFINGSLLRKRDELGQILDAGDRVLVIQALSGG